MADKTTKIQLIPMLTSKKSIYRPAIAKVSEPEVDAVVKDMS